MLLKRRRRGFEVEAWRAGMHRTAPLVPRPRAGTDIAIVEAGGVTVHRTTTAASRPERNVLYLHGGGYVSGGPAFYRHFTWRIANAAKARVWVIQYRLAPEHPFPAALDDALSAYRWLAQETGNTSGLFVMGDSAGAGLALCLLMKLRDLGGPLPAAAVAMSPWTDLALSGPSLTGNAASDPMLNSGDLPELARCYLAGADPRHPYASPLYGDPSGLPPVLIQSGSDEILRDDAVRMAERLRQANPRSRIEIWPRMPHAFQLFVPLLPESHAAIAQIGAFLAGVQAGPVSLPMISREEGHDDDYHHRL
jgi:acetyl esterase/lipase